ncbi:MAG: hypothetical protein IT488_05065 [Gammaproteobacteria bacterium]|nr:hypothetical protein [Gammaproteobacteria bacterium]
MQRYDLASQAHGKVVNIEATSCLTANSQGDGTAITLGVRRCLQQDIREDIGLMALPSASTSCRPLRDAFVLFQILMALPSKVLP